MRSKFKPPSPIPPIECSDSIVFDDSDNAEKFRHYFSSVYENDNGIKLFINRKSLSVLESIDFDVADVLVCLTNLVIDIYLLLVYRVFCSEDLLPPQLFLIVFYLMIVGRLVRYL